MSRISIWVCGLGVAAAVVIGCGPAKELPQVVPTGKSAGQIPPDPFGPAPDKSDPEARAVLDRSVNAITGGDLQRLEKAKVSRSALQGFVELPGSNESGEGVRTVEREATRSIEAVWPDRARVEIKFKEAATMTFRMRGTLGWLRNGPIEQNLDPVMAGQTMRVDMTALHWLFLGLPLADPNAIAFDLRKGGAGGREGTSVKLRLPDMGLPDTPVLQVSFDEKGLPVRVEYHPVEANQRPHKIVVLSGHKATEGLTLPGLLEMTQNGRTVERWTEIKWEFPDKISDDRFDPPK